MTVREIIGGGIRRITTEPPWSTREPVDGELILRGRTQSGLWGFGQHPSTSLCLSVLCGLFGKSGPDIDNVVELFCGSGLLTIASGALGASSAIGIESDAALRGLAMENRHRSLALFDARSRCAWQLRFVATPDEAMDHALLCPNHSHNKKTTDLAIANLTAPELHAQAGLLAKLATHGHLLIAGFVEEERESVEQEFLSRGFRFLYREVREGFYATVLKSRAADAKGTA